MTKGRTVIEAIAPKARHVLATVLWIATAILISSLASGPGASADGNARTGGWLAQHWCGGCHPSGIGIASDAVPSLQSIARQSQDNPAWLRIWLTDAHPRMPNFALSRSEIDDIVAYLEGLNAR